jgi:hypothetical protein
MMLGGFFGVVLGLYVMAVGQMRVVGGLLVIARFVVLGGNPVVLGSFFMMLGCLDMMFGGLLRHGNPPSRIFSGPTAVSVFEHTRTRLQEDGVSVAFE